MPDQSKDSLENSNVLLIGGSGFIGSSVAYQLAAEGVKLSALYHKNPPEPNGVRQLKGDFRKFDWTALEDDLPGVIIHSGRISGRTTPGRWLAGWQGAWANQRLVKWMESLKNPPRLVYVSGTLVYGSNGTRPVHEDAPLAPTGFQKYYLRAEYPLLNAAKTSQLPLYIARAPWVLGAGSWFRQFYWRQIQRQGEVPLFGDGENLMSIIHVSDSGRLINHIAKHSAKPGVVNMAVQKPVTQKMFCTTLSDLTGVPVKSYSLETLRRKYGKTVAEALSFSLNPVSDRTELESFKPNFPTLSETLADVIQKLEKERSD